MKAKFIFVALFTMALRVNAEPIDLELVMKNMALDYKQALKAENKDQFITELDELANGIETSKQFAFKQKGEQSLEGLNKVADVIAQAKTLAQQDDLEKAKSTLKQVDTHRKNYHKLHKKSVWQLIFG